MKFHLKFYYLPQASIQAVFSTRIWLPLLLVLFIVAQNFVYSQSSSQSSMPVSSRSASKTPVKKSDLGTLVVPPTPPVAAKKPKEMTLHGDTRTDDYFWLRDKTNPEVIAYLEAENTYFNEVMNDTKPLQEKLFKEMKSRIKETDQSAPAAENGYVYYSRTEAKKQYSIYCRRKGGISTTAKEEITLDMNTLAKGQKFLRLGVYEISPDTKLLAYALDYDGSRRFKLFVKDLTTGNIVEEGGIVGGAVVWANDNKTLFYNVYDDALRSFKIFRHTLGEDKSKDVEVFHEKDEKFDVYVSKTRSNAYIRITAASKMTRETWLLDANTPSGTLSVVEPRKAGHEYSVEHQGHRFLILSNDNAVNFRLMEAPAHAPQMANWKELVAHRPNVKLEDVDAFEKFFVLTERDGGVIKFQIFNDKGEAHYVAFPEASYSAGLGANADYSATTLRYGYESLTTPSSAYDYDMATRKQVLVKRKEIPGGYNPDNYASERLYATAPDGVKVPISLVYKKGLKKDGTNPTLLYGYGSYGIPMDASFNTSRLSLLDRGFVFAIAHIRGGGDIGEQWYLDGKFLKKKNTFTDFIACAEFLISEKYTTPAKLVIEGRSAGGLLMGAVTNMRPDLFKAVHMGVPFVDVINTMLDTSLPLTTGEYEEWGNPNDKQYYEYMKSYAPYENIEKKAYPHILFTTGLNDSQVPYWEPTKFLAKLRAMRTDKNLAVMNVNMGVGHGGASGRYDALKERAFELAFFFKVLGITK
jgi:oligopeptidase B